VLSPQIKEKIHLAVNLGWLGSVVVRALQKQCETYIVNPAVAESALYQASFLILFAQSKPPQVGRSCGITSCYAKVTKLKNCWFGEANEASNKCKPALETSL